MSPLYYYIKSLKYFLSFKPPVVIDLSSIDIIIAQKPLYLLSWTFARFYKLKILELNKTYYSKSGSVILKIPDSTNSITLIVSTIWHKRQFIRPLKKMKLEDAIAQLLIGALNPMKTFPVNLQSAVISKMTGHVLIPIVNLKTKPIEISQALKPQRIDIKPPFLIKEQINYSSQSCSI